MRVIIFNNPDKAADHVASQILHALGREPCLVLGLATGSTPLGVYARLVRAHRQEGVDFSRVTTFNLDEYLDLPADHPQSYRCFMRKNLFDGINVRPGAIHFPPAEGNRLQERCHEYEDLIRRHGGIDIQILGIGANGHIGFNEPTSSLASRTRVKTLTEKTILDNARFYGPGEKSPRMAATMGIGTILDTKKIFLHAFGIHKADAVYAAVEGPISSFWPASALQLHADVTFCLDPESASKLSLLEYYRRVVEDDVELMERGG